jgi:hypothetical protein
MWKETDVAQFGVIFRHFLKCLTKTTIILSLNRRSRWKYEPRATQMRMLRACTPQTLLPSECLQHPCFPYFLFLQTTFPTASLTQIPLAAGDALLSIFVSQTVLPRCHQDLIRDTVSALYVSLSRILSSRDKDRQKYMQMVMTFVEWGKVSGCSMKGLLYDPTRTMILTSLRLYLDLSCPMKQWDKLQNIQNTIHWLSTNIRSVSTYHSSLSLCSMRFQRAGASYFVSSSKVRLTEPSGSNCISSKVQCHVVGKRIF